MPIEYRRWMESHSPEGITEFRDFFRGISEARYVIRKVIRIVDEEARRHQLDPLEHQLLLQLLGADDQLNINRLADRLDVSAAVASRLVTALESRRLVTRRKSDLDRRVTDVRITEAGQLMCVAIWEDVSIHIDGFQQQLGSDAKRLALSVFGYYVGVELDVQVDGRPALPGH